MSDDQALLLKAPKVDVDALPYIDRQYNDPALKAQVDALVAAEMASFKPKDYLEPWPSHEPNFEHTQLLEGEWMRLCEKQPMPKMDMSRYSLDPPPAPQQNDLGAWERAVQNARAQVEHQANR